MAITVAASADYSISKTFTSDQQYALFAYNEVCYDVTTIDGWLTKISTSAIETEFVRSKTHPFFESVPTFNGKALQVQLSNYGDSINNKGLTTQLQKLPAWKSDPATVQLYTDFFHSIGSHTIVGTNYGARFQLVCSHCASYDLKLSD